MENPMNTTINKNQTWCSMWGNAVSIAEHRPESYAKDITLRYPVYAPFDGTALRITFHNYCVNLFPSRKQLSPSQTVILIAMTLQEK